MRSGHKGRTDMRDAYRIHLDVRVANRYEVRDGLELQFILDLQHRKGWSNYSRHGTRASYWACAFMGRIHGAHSWGKLAWEAFLQESMHLPSMAVARKRRLKRTPCRDDVNLRAGAQTSR